MKSKNLSEKILRTVKSKGFNYIELDSVIETNHIVERSGETFRRFIFSFKDQKGNELCLRPDLTIASCLRYLNENNIINLKSEVKKWLSEKVNIFALYKHEYYNTKEDFQFKVGLGVKL